MIPERITEEVFNNLEWKTASIRNIDINEELIGYEIIGAEPVYWKLPSNEEARDSIIDGINLYLKRPESEEIKIVTVGLNGNIHYDLSEDTEDQSEEEQSLEIQIAFVE